MNRGNKVDKESFLELSTKEIRSIVQQKGKPKVGVFVADGNRRMVMCQTRLSPTSDEFYEEYARIFVESLKKSLKIFFEHGLKTLFFPLFGPSLLKRKNKFQTLTIPAVYEDIFQSGEFLDFYNRKGIKLKAYGDLSKLNEIDVNNLNMISGVKSAIERTSSNKEHTVFFGFMSENTPGLELPQMIVNFHKTHNKSPSPVELIESYYGESLPPADFYIMSGKISHRGSLPPFVTTPETKMYYFPVPGFMGLTIKNLKKIIHDLLFVQTQHPPAEYSAREMDSIDMLNTFFKDHKNTIIGTSAKVGEFWVPSMK